MAAFGTTIFPTDYGMPVADLARAVEERGLDSIFFNEHSHIPVRRETPFPGGGELPRQYLHALDPFVALSIAAASTERIKLGTGICLVAQRDPIQLAKQVASLDVVSGGRAVLGIGAGWNAEEMRNHGTPSRQRWKVLREKVLAMREIWSKEAAEFHGEFVNFDPIWSWPKPVQGKGPKILLGSHSPRSFGRIIEYCDGWLPLAGPGHESDLIESLHQLRLACQNGGRDFESLELVAIGLGSEYDTAARLFEAGFHHLVFSIESASADVVLPQIDAYAALAQKIKSRGNATIP